LVRVSGLHLGEAEAVLLARRLGALFLVDEREASATARVFGVRPLGTVGVLLIGLAEGCLALGEFMECLDLLVGSGFWLSVDVYRRAVAEARLIAGEEA
jgi:predicted nucleic acid-binding protein